MVRKFAFLLLITMGVACQEDKKQKEDFQGFGELQLGAELEKLSFRDRLEATQGKELYIPSVELSEEIGVVEEVRISTKDHKISTVGFRAGKNTNDKVLREKISQLPEMGLNLSEENLKVKMYEIPSSNIVLTRMETTLPDSKTVEYYYFQDQPIK